MRRLTILATGSVVASGLPSALKALRAQRPELEVRVGLTNSARRFVTPRAVAMLCGAPPMIDAWSNDELGERAEHVEIEEWPDAFAVYPATAHFAARLRLGLCDTPFRTALASTRKPIGIALSVPPGMVENPAFKEHRATLREWPNVLLAPTHEGVSLTTGRAAEGAAGPLSEVVGLLDRWFAAPDDERPLAGLSWDWTARDA